ncbi:MAG: putative oxidoreductase [Rhodobacteraceae bacterium HLUCCA08]|nr:MAG: putative oxidoreductase [Rhodobacteraceae bacterium HLUCCA08]
MRQGFDFAGRTVLLTGATRGIGRALVDALGQRGATVLAVARDQGSVAKLVETSATVVDGLAVDLSDRDASAAIADWVGANHADTSVLINNAAVMSHGRLTDGSKEWRISISNEIDVNLIAPLVLSAELLPTLSRHPSAAIINVTSGLAIAPRRDAAVYCATKAGLRSFTRALRDQCREADLSIQVTEIVMTLVDTELTAPITIRKYPADRAAEDLLRGVERGLEEVWIEKAKALRVVHRLAPGLAYHAMRAR